MCSCEHYSISITPKALQDILDELEASRASRKRAWEVLQEIRWVLKDTTGIDLPAPAPGLFLKLIDSDWCAGPIKGIATVGFKLLHGKLHYRFCATLSPKVHIRR